MLFRKNKKTKKKKIPATYPNVFEHVTQNTHTHTQTHRHTHIYIYIFGFNRNVSLGISKVQKHI